AQGNMEAVRFLKGLAEAKKFKVDISEEIAGGVAQANLLVSPNEKPQKLLLQTHLDTVDPGSFALWNKTGFNPYQASIRGDNIYGLGAADVKLDFLCKLFAMEKVDWSRLSGSAVLLGTFGEEQQMKGAIKAVRERKITPTPALIGEPTDMQVIYAGKGIAQLEIIIPFQSRAAEEWSTDEGSSSSQSKIFQGRAAHSSSPEMGENAIVKMLDYLILLPDSIHVLNVDGGVSFNTIPTQAALEFELSATNNEPLGKQLRAIYSSIKELEVEFKKHSHPDFDPPYSTMNLGSIRTSHDHIRLAGAVRWTSHISESLYGQWMNFIAETCKKQKSVFRILDVKKPFQTDRQGDFASLCHKTITQKGVSAEMKTQSVTNEANVLSRFGFECIVFGPGQRQNNSHTPEEHVSLQDLKIAEEFYQTMIEKVCV
ncbi:M20/M25/M40 family metallo-hydrolase, partial [bacterium]|nr:M20/M25/M40 family metallo-hydrolase [bacterium]